MNQQSSAAPSPSLISIYSTPPKIQNFSLPENIIFYISKNPLIPYVYINCINSCKYFYLNQPLIVFENLADIRGSNFWAAKKINGLSKPFNRESSFVSQNWVMKELPKEKLWIYGSLLFAPSGGKPSYPGVSLLIPKIYRCNITELEAWQQNITVDEFELISGSLQNLEICHSFIRNLDGAILTIEKIIEMLSNLQIFHGIYNAEGFSHLITPETSKALTKIPHFNNLKRFSFHNAPGIDQALVQELNCLRK